MCGIAGFINLPNNWQDNINRMNDRMYHRGPDDCGVWHNENPTVVIGHRRLSIIDLSSAGSQPMISKNGRYVIALNGEIYNHIDLKCTLLDKGIKFYGHSDTEIFLEYISFFGLKKALKDSKGMFAFSLYDKDLDTLYLARDRIGEKPLYYGYIAGGFVFASELSVIEEHEDFNADIDYDALGTYFRLGYIPAPRSIYKQIRKLGASSVIAINAKTMRITESYLYWDIIELAKRQSGNKFKGSYNEAVDMLESLLGQSIKLQMMADVSVGAFLSGGVDSTTVVGIAQSLRTQPVKTYTIGFEVNDFDESKYAKDIASHLGANYIDMMVTERECVDIIPKIPSIYSEPFADPSQIPTYFVSKLASDNVKVSLSGDGGDELFCGYTRYIKYNNRWKNYCRIPYGIRSAMNRIFGFYKSDNRIGRAIHYLKAKTPGEMYALSENLIAGIDSIVLNHESQADYDLYNGCQNIYPSNGVMSGYMLVDMMLYLPDDILVKVDRSAMSVSLESRIPLLDKDVVEFALSLPIEFKCNNNSSKSILRDVLYRYVPKEMMERPKQGFSIPMAHMLKQGVLREWCEDLLSKNNIESENLLDYKVVSRLKKNFFEKDIYSEKLWFVLMFEQWMDYKKRL